MQTDKDKPGLKATVTVKFFGMLTDVAGMHELVANQNADLVSLRLFLLEKFPALKDHSFIVAVNKQVTQGNRQLFTGDEVALLPPFSGG